LTLPDVAFGTILELFSVFKEASRNFVFIFLFNKAGYGRLKFAHILWAFKQKYSSGDQISLNEDI
jgi:hypothetical protein